MMKIQAKISSYGVSPVESPLAGEAPGPLPRRDPPQATGRKSRRKRGARHPLRDKATGQKPAVFHKNTPSSGLSKDNLQKQKDQFETLNIVQFNISGLSTKKSRTKSFFR